AKIDPAVSGQHGHNQTYKAACKAGPGFDLPPDVALGLLREFSLRCRPPWTEAELRHKVNDAYKNDPRRGWLRDAPPRNGLRGAGPPAEAVPPDDDDDTAPIETRPWPDPPEAVVYHGLAGDIVRTIAPQSEADPLGLLAQFLVMFGNMIGRGPHFVVEATRH